MPSIPPEDDPTQVIQQFHARLDEARREITDLRESDSHDNTRLAILVKQEKALRYQVGQLRDANTSARADLTSGLDLSCTELERQIAAIRNGV